MGVVRVPRNGGYKAVRTAPGSRRRQAGRSTRLVDRRRNPEVGPKKKWPFGARIARSVPGRLVAAADRGQQLIGALQRAEVRRIGEVPRLLGRLVLARAPRVHAEADIERLVGELQDPAAALHLASALEQLGVAGRIREADARRG